jgi:hypothetical protein
MTLSKILLLSTVCLGLGAFIAAPVQAEDYDCDAHATHIDAEIGAEKALDAFHVLHGDHADDHHIVDELKKSHPDIEHELEEYVKHGCGEAELKAHADDH